jgi:alkyldihydroxyacetonephosphate synthase
MRRWNGWGDEAVEFALHDEALAFLAQRIGAGTPVQDATLEQACARIAPSRLPPDASVAG